MSQRNHTDMGGSAYAFLTTHWSLIQDIQAEDKDRVLIGFLIQRYWKPVYCYVRQRGLNNEQAKDLTQGFFHDIVLNRELVQRADPKKGRFRTFLLHALDQYLACEWRKERAVKRYPKGGLVRLEALESAELPSMSSLWTPEYCFHYAWLSDLLQQVLSEVQQQCRLDGLEQHWQVFQDRIVDPILSHTEAPPLSDLCLKYGIDRVKRASNMVITVKRRFQICLRTHPQNSVSSQDQVSDEFSDILQYFP